MIIKMVEQTSLRHKLILYKYMLHNFGVSKLQELNLADRKEGYDVDTDQSYFFGVLVASNINIEKDTLKKYDHNIKSYLDIINKKRNTKIQLKYFQYITLLFTELFLDNFFNRSNEFLNEINKFVDEDNKINKEKHTHFSKNDLTKLAYWMATGSGKTLIMHINWLQFKKYNTKKIDHVLLITPNESLSKQHLEEFRDSDILAKRFSGSENPKKDEIQIIEISKLTEEKKGQGLSIQVSAFEGNNLVFVDEGHKGFSGEVWKNMRDKISELGFTFEYSATFDEAIRAKNDEILEEYSKAIIMDYSYSHFYRDGFGKEFEVINLKNSKSKEHQEHILLINVLSYYQQLKFYIDNKNNFNNFSFEKPLWIFVGNSVGKTNKEDPSVLSDLQLVVKFFDELFSNKNNFIEKIDKIMNDKISLMENDEDVKFSERFEFIKNTKFTSTEIYDDILELVFNSKNTGKLELWSISSSSGEIALKVSGSEYFGIVYIGDIPSFKKNLITNHKFNFSTDVINSSHFEKINESDSQINILLGAKRFKEGWNSFRVSTMGLLNIGKSKGPEIIQLFGRGVRLRGYKNLMKRSKILRDRGDISPSEFKIDPSNYLEKLGIFGIKADYIDTFKRELENEGVLEEEHIVVEIKKNTTFLNKKLKILKQKDSKYSDVLLLEFNDSVPTIKIDNKAKFEIFSSDENKIHKSQIQEKSISIKKYFEILDWERIYFELYNFKQNKEFYNLYFNKEILFEIIKKIKYEVFFDETFEVDTFKQFLLIENISIVILKKYITDFYNINKREWITNNLKYEQLTKSDANFQNHSISIDKSETVLIKKIKKLIKNKKLLLTLENDDLHSIIFDRHLFQPLISKDPSGKIRTSPDGLNKGEKELILDLRNYLTKNKKSMIKYEFYLLRNLPKKGVGFFADVNNFFPDFILWIVKGNKQNIIFIDPKGLIHAPGKQSPKIQVWQTLKEIETKLKDKNIQLTSFIVAGETSEISAIRTTDGMKTQQDFEDNHVVFQNDDKYIEKIITSVIS